MAGGQAAVPKNVIHMQVSSLGITLMDKEHWLFVNRNYPRKQLEGCCLKKGVRETKEAMVLVEECVETVSNLELKLLCSCIPAPWTSPSMKVHVFRQVQESTEQIMDAIKLKFWLEIDPVPSPD